MTTTAAPPVAQATGLRASPWGTLVAIAFGVMMVALDGTIVAVANPAIGASLGASLAELQWVTHGYLLGLAVFLITAGRLGDRFGHRKMYLVGTVGFVLASVAIALSAGVIMLIAFRILQGVFGALLLPSAMGLLRSVFPPHKLGRAFGVFGSLIGAATAGGPIIGGLLVGSFGWQAVFYINVPVGAVALGLGLWLLAANRPTDPGSRLDVPGIVLLSVAIFALVWALVEAPAVGWTHPVTLASLGAALLFGAAFVLWERRPAHPLLPLGIFANPSVSIGTVLMVLMALGLMGSLFFITFYLQGVRGMSPAQTGMQLIPMTAMMAITSPIAGRVLDRFGARIPTALGLVLSALGMFLLSRLDADSGVAHISIGFVLLGVGLSLVMTGATAAIIGNAPVRFAGVASAVQQAAMQLGGSLGTAVLGAVMSATIVSTLPGHYAAAGLDVPAGEELAGMQSLVAQGGAALPEGVAPETAQAITQASNLAFLDGMHLAFGIAAVVMTFAAVLSLAMRSGTTTGEPAVHV
ncbi:DHA2 family efflux MFS transporter permease subunit [Nocardiopsis ansamitocini]|uniref:MFS transporter n=1 Tax=Nocardiopsis ansamitocini TaxID=1670832 RepID=A0A9W6P698_9ACTN|nr:DHA2 family efflux MFS transporter permease subunit [Nocardiopsis ansamitocini]GLU47826.1 MFS transporter [Nocardiopsis ansamitocini]